MPEYEKVAKKLAVDQPSVLIGKLDVSLYPNTAAELDVRGDDPQFIYFYHSKPYSFEEFKSSAQLLSTLHERSTTVWLPPRPHPELVPDLSQQGFEQTVKELDFAVVAFYRSK